MQNRQKCQNTKVDVRKRKIVAYFQSNTFHFVFFNGSKNCFGPSGVLYQYAIALLEKKLTEQYENHSNTFCLVIPLWVTSEPPSKGDPSIGALELTLRFSFFLDSLFSEVL